jgi:hypothetical protein
MEEMYFNYIFKLKNGIEKRISVNLDKELNVIAKKKENYPDWVEMKKFRCKNCNLQEDKKVCPVAYNLLDIIEDFKDIYSYEEAEIVIETPERTYFKKTSVQAGIGSLMGIYMVTSGCPTLEKLKPMVKFHLPFATIEETMYRVISMFMTAQLLKEKQGLKSGFDLKEIIDIYSEIEKVNINFAKKLNELNMSDASINAIVLLNSFASFANLSFDDDLTEMLGKYFKMYLQ